MSKLAFAIARCKWAIEIHAGLAFYPKAHMLLTGKRTAWNDEGEEPTKAPFAFVETPGGRFSIDQILEDQVKLPYGSIGVVDFSGPIMKESFCGIAGSMEMAEQIKLLDSLPELSAILSTHDSPGGMVDGTPTAADAIRNCSKRTISLVNDGMSCSADYWIASASDEMYATHNTCEIGSIGVYATLSDYSKYYEDLGLKVEDIYAPQSTEKNEGFKDWKAGNAETFRQRLGLTATEFISVVEDHRKGKLNLSAGDPFKGRVYGARQATEIGLIDGIKKYDAVMHDLLNQTQTLKFI
ncbi:MAG: S49 family peptidase [Flavobacteriales bacterium]